MTRRQVEYFSAFASIAALVVLLSLSKIADDDVFWHLATGRWIAQNHSIPTADVFGFVTHGQRWIPFEWGWDLLTFWLYSITGNLLLVEFLPGLVWLAVAGLLFTLARDSDVPPSVILAVMLLTALASIDRMTPRPHLATILGIAATVTLYMRVRVLHSAPESRLNLLPPLFLVWTNVHPGVLIGAVLIVLMVTYEALTARGHLKNFSRFGVISLLSLCATLCNPAGPGMLQYAYSHTNLRLLSTIIEWQPPIGGYLNTRTILFYKIDLLLGAACILYSLRNKNPLPAMIYAVLALHSLRAARFMADFAAGTAAGTALGLSLMFGRLRSAIIPLVALTLFIACCVPGNRLYDFLRYDAKFGLGIDEERFSSGLVGFMKDQRITGKPLNSFDIGGQLVWEMPGAQNFIDSRNLNDSIMAAYLSLLEVSPHFEQLLGRYGFDHMVFHLPELPRSAASMSHTPIPYCFAHRDRWKLVYWDDHALLYLLESPRFRNVIQRYEYKILDPYLFAFHHQRFDSLRSAEPERFREETLRKNGEGLLVRFMTGRGEPRR